MCTDSTGSMVSVESTILVSTVLLTDTGLGNFYDQYRVEQQNIADILLAHIIICLITNDL